MPAPWTRARHLVIAVTGLIAVACKGTLETTPVAMDAVSNDVGMTARDEVEASVDALTLATTVTPIGTTQAPTGFSVPCVNPSTPADADGDGVPDDATYSFTAPPCRFDGWRGGTLDLVGQLRVKDPAPSSAGFGYDATLTSLRSRFTDAAKKAIYDVTRSGSRVLSGSVAALLLTSDLQVARTFVGKPDAALIEQWTLNYTPSTPLQINGAVNSGTLDISGTLNWTRGTEEMALTVTTPTPLQYDASCTDTVQRIKAGELRATGKFDGNDGYVRVRWSGCGKEPAFAFVPAG